MTVVIIADALIKGALGEFLILRFQKTSTDTSLSKFIYFQLLFSSSGISTASASRAGVLKHSDHMVPMSESTDKWLLSKILQDKYFGREPMDGASPSERADKDDNNPLSQMMHQTVFADHSQGEGVTINLVLS